MIRYLKNIVFLFCMLYAWSSFAAYVLVPMDDAQKNHLKAYGIAYRNLEMGEDVNWLLNYRGGSFAMEENAEIVKLCKLRGVTYELISNSQMSVIVDEISDAEVNMDVVKLQKAPKIAVYSPKSKRPWDDAVTLVLSYAEIPYDVIYDEEVLNGVLPTYDWLHLHHEDFTGQYGKFWANYRTASWYKEDVAFQESLAKQLGFSKVSMLKLAVVKKIRDFVLGGGFMFAMCSATDSFDIALAAEGVDICESMFDGDAMDPQAQKKLNYENCFAFKDFHIETNPMQYRISDIDDSQERNTMVKESNDVFVLFDFSAKWDWIPTMLTQNHTRVIKGFFGQTSGFKRQFIKSNVLIMGENKSINEVRYIHGEYGKGTWSFLSGHDPEDYRHFVGDPKTDLSLFPTSPGFRLILNNILFPAAKKEKHKT
ncbi:MAG: asparagine synthetase B [Bacteroidales bacterium]|nr:asparagine synthetase B [Bacteroidales bacterium]